jgi:HemX protein
MFTKSWIYDAIVYLYAISLLFYFSDLVNNRKNANRTGFWLLISVWVLQTVYFVIRTVNLQYLPIVTLFDSLFFYAWLLVTVSVIIHYFLKVDFIVFVVGLIGFGVMTLNFFTDPNVVPTGQHSVLSELLFIHISLSILSYVVFLLAAILSAVYLLGHHMLKRKKFNSFFRGIPSLEQLDRIIFGLVIAGVPLLLLGMILGGIWAHLKMDAIFWSDPKVIGTMLVLMAYSIDLFQRASSHWGGKQSAKWNLAAFATVLVNFILSNTLSNFHHWM